MPNAANVTIGAPEQSATVGAILDAPIGTALPASTSDTLNNSFKSSGFVSEDGVRLSPSISTTDIKDWSGSIVRKIIDSFDGTIVWSELEMTYESMCHAFGADNVIKTAANAQHGEQLKVSLGAHLPAARSWVFRMKDGDKRLMIVVPNGQVTEVGEMSFMSSEAIKPEITLSCYDDGTGNSIYIYTDDGLKVSA